MFRLATLNDKPAILQLIAKYIHPNHVYVRRSDLFEYDFACADKLNIAVIEHDGSIEGIFGYFFYNYSLEPDIGGMLWISSDRAQKWSRFAWIQLRDFVLKSVKHRFCGAPGANVKTKIIYERFKKSWMPMEHFVCSLRPSSMPDFLKIRLEPLRMPKNICYVSQIRDFDEIKTLDPDIFYFQCPIKDLAYLCWRYFDNPFREYLLWRVDIGKTNMLVVIRIQNRGPHKILRVIDLIGKPELAADAISAVYHSIEGHYCYLDFVAAGFMADTFFELGFAGVDFSDARVIVPNHFEPFVAESSQIHAVCDSGFSNVTMVKGNGDQDRPNFC